MFKEEFKKQGESVTNLISDNYKLTMQETNELKNEINELKKR